MKKLLVDGFPVNAIAIEEEKIIISETEAKRLLSLNPQKKVIVQLADGVGGVVTKKTIRRLNYVGIAKYYLVGNEVQTINCFSDKELIAFLQGMKADILSLIAEAVKPRNILREGTDGALMPWEDLVLDRLTKLSMK